MSEQCMIAIRDDGLLVCAASLDVPDFDEMVAEWANDKRITQILKVPVDVPRLLLFEQWPGMEAACLAAVDARARGRLT